jgi:8-oxo-dGTP pyrophosphatase MutT (NUDIX family)
VNFRDVVARLERELRRELPGARAQNHLAPTPRRNWPAGFNPARIRNAAGLLLVFPMTTESVNTADQAATTTINADTAEFAVEDQDFQRVQRVLRFTSAAPAHIVLTVRGDALRHGGQISLPGGVVEPGETFEQTALREAHEEIALAPATVRVLGPLTPLDIPVSGFRLHPIVGVSDERPRLAAADGEVAHILEVGVDALLDPRHFASTDRERNGLALTIPAFHVGGREIWGATAMVLAEFLTLLGWSPALRH